VISKPIQGKGILARFLEQGIKILLIRECKKISNLKIDIFASSLQIIKGELPKIQIFSEDINYKDLLFDKVELEASQIKIDFNLLNKELNFNNNPKIKLKISFSEKSIKNILLSNNWNWIGNTISKEILNKYKLDDIKIKKDKLQIISSKNNNYKLEQVKLTSNTGKIYLKNMTNNKTFLIPIEEKIYINKLNIVNNLLIIFADTSISFE
tara:strand:- start:98 stop:727 length:630 start_codon:yes stop_codon:yes gene_type:complete